MLNEERLIQLLGVLRMYQIGEEPDVEEVEELIGVLTDEVGYIATVALKRKALQADVVGVRDMLQEQMTESKIRRVCSAMSLSRREEQAVIEEVYRVGIEDYHRMTVDEIMYDIENFMPHIQLDEEEM